MQMIDWSFIERILLEIRESTNKSLLIRIEDLNDGRDLLNLEEKTGEGPLLSKAINLLIVIWYIIIEKIYRK